LDESAFDDLRLLVSELVTNSVRHAPKRADNCIHLKVFESGEVVRVEVDDPGSGFEPAVRVPRPGQTSGWGLFLVDQLASDWGVEAPGLTRVWLTIPRAQERSMRH
jgi:anti-sigma regulatory factor (Ser/Thr protein kinase)